MNIIYLICLVVAVALSFFLGRQYGKDKQEIEFLTDCDTKNSIANAAHARKIETTNKVEIEAGVEVDCVEPAPGMCNSFSDRKVNGLHLASSTVPQDVFGFLHHPGSPAKWNYYVTKEPEWPSNKVLESPCQEIYLTRTGSRGNQPNKCVAVTIVPEGYISNNQQSHRVGEGCHFVLLLSVNIQMRTSWIVCCKDH